MKRLLSVFLMLLSVTIMQAQQIVHTVQRGETLESIAQKYNVSKETITKNNPYVDESFYVGMKLYIPKQLDNISDDNVYSNSNVQMDNTYQHAERPSSDVTEKSRKRFEFEVFAGVSLNNNVGDGISDTKMKIGGHVGFTGRYYIVGDFWGEVSLAFATKGYKQTVSSTSGQYWDDYGPNYDSELKTTMTTYNLDIPINIGYAFTFSDNLKLRIKAGPYFTFAISGELKETGYTEYFEDTHSSETDHINKTTKLNDLKGYEKFSIGIQGGIGLEIGKFVLSGTFQRGLTKLYTKNKLYEQNILISLGYKI